MTGLLPGLGHPRCLDCGGRGTLWIEESIPAGRLPASDDLPEEHDVLGPRSDLCTCVLAPLKARLADAVE